MPQSDYLVEPYYNGEIGAYTIGVPPASVTYTWSSKGSNANPFTSDGDGLWIHTDQDLGTLGTVTGTADIIIGGNSTIGTAGDEATGSVYGGGEESAVDSDTHVLLRGNTHVLGNVFGGGNKGVVGGSTHVKICDDCDL